MLNFNFSRNKIYLLLFLILYISTGCAQQSSTKVLNVKDYGAKGDGKSEDYAAIQKCLTEAKKFSKVKVIVPFGTYKIGKMLVMDFLRGDVSILGRQKGGLNPTFLSQSQDHMFVVVGYLFNESSGNFRISNLNLVGNNTPFNAQHPKINQLKWSAGLAIFDKLEAYIDNVTIRDFYGDGIYISTTKQEGIAATSCFQRVEISNSKIINVWGFNPKTDNYGDGIYVSNARSGIIKNNFVENNTQKTRQLGRAGIVIEYMCRSLTLQNNKVIEGYDRALHVEQTDGGHKIFNNTFNGSDLGMILSEDNARGEYQSVYIEGNSFSNKNFKKNVGLRKSFAKDSPQDRALMYITTKNISPTKGIFINGNIFEIDGNFTYDSNAIINNRSDNLTLSNNIIKVINTSKKLFLKNFSNISRGNDWSKPDYR